MDTEEFKPPNVNKQIKTEPFEACSIKQEIPDELSMESPDNNLNESTNFNKMYGMVNIKSESVQNDSMDISSVKIEPSELDNNINESEILNVKNEDVNPFEFVQTNYSNSKNKMMTCEYCNKIYETNNELKVHVMLVHEYSLLEIKKDHKCDICSETFSATKYLNWHLKNTHGQLYKCEICKKEFKWKEGKLKHIRYVHEGIKDSTCDICGKVFGQPSTLKQHIQTVHEGLKPHKCGTCGKAFSQSGDLNRHISAVHGGEKNHKCEKCEKVFSNTSYLKKHVKAIHEKK